ncbi:MAG: hypothetical protein CM15mP74_16050 [Halieaceae bacterium]|nr:MAG: hypothetical protein CM15mP74_16050 [Halieaceae bacterium]
MPPKGRSGRREVARLSYSIDAVAEFEDFVEDMYDFADQQQLDVDTLIHENGAAQLEINFNHDPLAMADQVFVFKRTVRETAQRYNMYATSWPSPCSVSRLRAPHPSKRHRFGDGEESVYHGRG